MKETLIGGLIVLALTLVSPVMAEDKYSLVMYMTIETVDEDGDRYPTGHELRFQSMAGEESVAWEAWYKHIDAIFCCRDEHAGIKAMDEWAQELIEKKRKK